MKRIMPDNTIWTIHGDDKVNITESTSSSKNSDVTANYAQPNFIPVQSRFRRKYYQKTVYLILCLILILLIIAIIYLALLYKNRNTICTTRTCLRSASNLLESMDKTINPCDDFYRFTCGNWPDEHPRQDTEYSLDWFSEKQNKILRKVRQFLQQNSSKSEPNAVTQAKIMYKACINVTAKDVLGLQPMFDYLNGFSLPDIPRLLIPTANGGNSNNSLNNNITFNWIITIAKIKKILGSDFLIGFSIFPDFRNRTIKRLAFGIPDGDSLIPFKQDYEQKLERYKRMQIFANDNDKKEDDDDNDDDDDDDENVAAKEAYKNYMTNVFSVLISFKYQKFNRTISKNLLETATSKIVQLSTLIYEIVEKSENSTGDVEFDIMNDLLYFKINDFQNITDLLILPITKRIEIWRPYLKQLYENITIINNNNNITIQQLSSINYTNELIITTPNDLEYLQNLFSLLANTSSADIELYIWWNLIEDMLVHTTNEMRQLHNDYAKEISNLQGGSSLTLYCTHGTNNLLGMAISYGVADKNFITTIKPKVAKMLNYIRESFNNLVRWTTWMDENTKCKTLHKSMAMRSLIGFPEWLNKPGELDKYYAGVYLNQSKHLDNLIILLKLTMEKVLKTYFISPEDIEWDIMPTHVNAFHTFHENAITIPLAILQYPFYDHGLEALNYGAIGTILGHELTHGFDDVGRMYDKNGNIQQWWTNKTVEEYINRTSCFVEQYGNYYLPEVSKYIDGRLTLGENIADNGGLREAYYAYQMYVRDNGAELKLPGLQEYTHDQLFFISFGNLWCETHTEKSLRWALADSHCPGKIRLKGVLVNSREFSDTFGCTVGTQMYSSDRCRIW